MKTKIFISIAVLSLAFSLGLAGCSGGNQSASTSSSSQPVVEEPAVEELVAGDVVENENFKITFNGAKISSVITYPNSSTVYKDAESGKTFVLLYFNVEALNSEELRIDKYALSKIVANYNENTYKSATIKYFNRDNILINNPGDIEAHMPMDMFVCIDVPADASAGAVTVDMEVAEQPVQIAL